MEWERKANNQSGFWADYALNKDDYHAAWLLDDFSGVQDESGKAHVISNFDLQTKAGLMKTLKQSDPEFSK
jgi:hypothetical protein